MKYYKRVDAQGKMTTVESYSHDQKIIGAIEITEQEYKQFIASLPPPPLGPDYKVLYSNAFTDRDKLEIIAKKLGLVNE